MTRKIFTIFLIAFIGFTAFSPIVFAQPGVGGGDAGNGNPIWGGRNPVTCNESGEDPCTVCDAFKVGANITDFLIQLSLALGVLMTVYGGLLILFSGSSEKRYAQGKSAITWAIIGIVITLSAWVIINTIIHAIVGGGVSVPWSGINC